MLSNNLKQYSCQSSLMTSRLPSRRKGGFKYYLTITGDMLTCLCIRTGAFFFTFFCFSNIFLFLIWRTLTLLIDVLSLFFPNKFDFTIKKFAHMCNLLIQEGGENEDSRYQSKLPRREVMDTNAFSKIEVIQALQAHLAEDKKSS